MFFFCNLAQKMCLTKETKSHIEKKKTDFGSIKTAQNKQTKKTEQCLNQYARRHCVNKWIKIALNVNANVIPGSRLQFSKI